MREMCQLFGLLFIVTAFQCVAADTNYYSKFRAQSDTDVWDVALTSADLVNTGNTAPKIGAPVALDRAKTLGNGVVMRLVFHNRAKEPLVFFDLRREHGTSASREANENR